MPQEFFRLLRCFAVVAIAGSGSLLAACGGGGGGGGGGLGGGGNGGGSGTVTVSGRITFDRLAFQTTANTGLNAAAPVVSPAREVVVEAVIGGAAVATTTTDSNGNYSFSVPASSTAFIRARAQMMKAGSAPTWNFTVRNNANSDAVYALQGDSFNTGTTALTRNLNAPSGWGGSSYTGTRAAAPFAILDTIYRAKQLILGASASATFPDLNLYWSITNKNAGDPFCPDTGNIGTSFYTAGGDTENCVPSAPAPLPAGIYILGFFSSGGSGDTDEFDAHVIAHEFGHYFEAQFGRSDSIGGIHGGGDRLDSRVAFGEGWGNAYAAMTQNDPVYRDSYNGISQDFQFDMEQGSALNEGWFSEGSVGEFIWDVFDNNTTPESGDNVALGFNPIFAVMTDEQQSTDALTSVFSFAAALRSDNPSVSANILALLGAEAINGSDAFGAGETNDGNVLDTLPVYQTVTLGAPGQVYVCNSLIPENTVDLQPPKSVLNKLGNNRLLRFDNDVSRTVVIRAAGATMNASQDAAADPDIYVYRRGETVATGLDVGVAENLSTTLGAGTYVIEVYDDQLDTAGSRPRCMTVSITG